MPYDDPDAGDPMTLHGVLIETEDDGAMREMAECFIEEFARLGFDAGRILKLFTNPGYAGPFLAYQTLGDEAIRAFIDEQMSLRNHDRSGTPPLRGAGGEISLPVLDR